MLAYPSKSHRKTFNLPKDNNYLAELLGIHFGDGGINNPWQIIISLNSKSDLDFALYIIYLFKKLFNYTPKIRKRPHQNTLVVVSTGTNLVDFFIKKGAVKGNKIKNIKYIPSWIEENLEFSKYFIRGLMDTDGCLFIQKKNDKEYIGLCFTNFSKPITRFVAKTFKRLDIKPHISDKGRRIYLYSCRSVRKYLDVIGSSNSRITNKYISWRDAGVADQARLESV